ncbi:MAG: cupin domain-containing protein [Flavobacteriales bacterium]
MNHHLTRNASKTLLLAALLSITFLNNTNAQTPETMEKTLAMTELKNFGTPDEVREFPKGRVELIKIGGATIGRAVFEPGWRWSESVQPIAKTKSCEAPHFQYHVSGVLRVRMDDGQEFDCKPGDVSLLPSGHDAWTVGDKPAVVVDFQGMVDYATESHKH